LRRVLFLYYGKVLFDFFIELIDYGTKLNKNIGSSASFMVEPLTLLLNNARGNHESLCL